MNENKCDLINDDALVVREDGTEYTDYESNLFNIFKELYIDSTLFYNNNEVHMKEYPPEYGIKSGFYHIICENYMNTGNEDDRYPNFRRCERIKFPKKIIESCSRKCSSLLVWENQRYGKTNIVLFCPEIDYVVILAKRNGYLLLTTAYPVDRPHTKRKLMKEYLEYNKQRTTT